MEDKYRKFKISTGCSFAELCKAEICPKDKMLSKSRRADAKWICEINQGVIEGRYPELERIVKCR